MPSLKTQNLHWLNSKDLRRSLPWLLAYALPIWVYIAVLKIGVTPEVTPLAQLQDFPGWVAIGAVLLLYGLYQIPGWLGTLLSLSATLTLFAFPLSGLWMSGSSSRFVVGGLLQLSDAGGYYWEASRLVEGEAFTAWGSRRPMSLALLAAIFELVQQNLQVTLAVLLAIVAISCFFCARELQRSYGTIAGALGLVLLFLFFRPMVGQTVTEGVGLAFGALSLALLLRGIRSDRLFLSCFGIFTLTLALVARAGAFFVLPALILWGAWIFRGTSRISWRFLLGGFSAVVAGFVCNSLLLKIIGSPDAVPFSNYSFVLYSLVSGNKWNQVLLDHPSLNDLQDADRSISVYAIAFEMIRADPLSLVRGTFRAWREFLWWQYNPLFFNTFIFTYIDSFSAEIVLGILTWIGAAVCGWKWRQPLYSMLLAANLGIFLSIPLIPPWSVSTPRVHAAILPLFAALAAIGLAFLLHGALGAISRIARKPILSDSPTSEPGQPWLAFGFSILLVILTVLMPIGIRFTSQPPQFTKLTCPANLEVAYFRMRPGSTITLVNNAEQTRVPNVRVRDFRKGLEFHERGRPVEVAALKQLQASTTLMSYLDLEHFGYNWLVVESSKLSPSGIFGACGTLEKVGALRLFRPESIQPVR